MSNSQIRLRPHGQKKYNRFFSRNILKIILCVLTFCATAGMAIVGRGLMKLAPGTTLNLLNAGESSYEMTHVALYMVLEFCGSLAWPLLAFLTVEGFLHTSSPDKYILRVGLLALVSEIPYDLATSGVWFFWGQQNILFLVAISLVLLWILHSYARTGGNSLFRKVLFVVMAILSGVLLCVPNSALFIALIVVLYYFRTQERTRNLLAVVLTILDFPAPFSVLFMIWYDENRCKGVKWFYYAAYPVHLLILGLIGVYLL